MRHDYRGLVLLPICMAKIAIETSGPNAVGELNDQLDEFDATENQIRLTETKVEDGRIRGLKVVLATNGDDIASDDSQEEVAPDGGTTTATTTHTGPTPGHTHGRPHTGPTLAEEVLEYLADAEDDPTTNDLKDAIHAGSKESVQKAASRLRARGYVNSHGRGIAFDPFNWTLTEQGERAVKEYRADRRRIQNVPAGFHDE